jgi:hypothetical protein
MVGVPITDYEDVSVYGLDADVEIQLIEQQNECTFAWVTADGSPMAVIMSYLVHEGSFWLTASRQRKRIPAIQRDGRVAIVITSTGSTIGRNKAVTYKGVATVHDDEATKAWFYPALAARLVGRGGPDRVAEFVKMLDSPRRVVIEVKPRFRQGFDGAKMAKATEEARRAGVTGPEI